MSLNYSYIISHLHFSLGSPFFGKECTPVRLHFPDKACEIPLIKNYGRLIITQVTPIIIFTSYNVVKCLSYFHNWILVHKKKLCFPDEKKNFIFPRKWIPRERSPLRRIEFPLRFFFRNAS